MEIFKRVNHKDEYFDVSNYGRVKMKNIDGIRRTYKNTSGYEYFTTKYAILVHRLVAIAFIPNPENKGFVNHKDGNKFNNHVSNLEWVTRSENERHSLDVLGNKRNIEGLRKTWADSPNKKPVDLYLIDGGFYKSFSSGRDCAKYLNCSPSSVNMVLVGKNKTVKGYIAKYKL